GSNQGSHEVWRGVGVPAGRNEAAKRRTDARRSENEGEFPMKWRFGKAAMWLVVAVMVANLAVPAAAQRRRPNRPVVDLPRGPVRPIILRSCTACHGIDDNAFHAMDRAGWQALIETMKEKGAVISAEDRSILLDWLVAKFGPDSKPFQPGQAPPPTLADG